jgi:hypothetical protein
MHFIDELIAESEKAEAQQRLDMTKLRADQLLMAIQVLEGQQAEVDKLFQEELKIIEEYRFAERERLQKKVNWLVWNLEQYMRSTGEKTLNLPHGILKLRMGRDKIQIADLERFLAKAANQRFLKTIPESFQPDMQVIGKYVRQTGDIPTGVSVIPAEAKFHYSTINQLKGAEENGKAVA